VRYFYLASSGRLVDPIISGSHSTGTAAVSPHNAAWGVLNPDLTVKKVVGLSVVDGSGIPYVPSAHTQGVIYLWAERAADQIKARA
jgi:choline dehydrogenase-like flavoprotein